MSFAHSVFGAPPIQTNRRCVSIYRVTGSDHYLAKVSVTSISHLEQLVDRFIPFATVTTSIVLSVPVLGRTIDQGIFPEAERPKS